MTSFQGKEPFSHTSTLLAGNQDARHPPLQLRLSPEALASFKAHSGQVRIHLGSNASLKIGDESFNLTCSDERGSLEAFVAAKGDFRSVGMVRQTLAVRRTPAGRPNSIRPSTPITNSRAATPSTPTATSLAKPDLAKLLDGKDLDSPEMRVAHLLAGQSMSARRIVQNTHLSPISVQRLLANVARPAGDDLFILRDDAYEHLRIWDFKYHETDREQALQAARAAFKRLGYGDFHSAVQALDNSMSLAAKRTRPTPPLEESELDTMAHKFRSTYPKYARLYEALVAGPQSPEQLEKLNAMHRQLAIWKEQLWAGRKATS